MGAPAKVAPDMNSRGGPGTRRSNRARRNRVERLVKGADSVMLSKAMHLVGARLAVRLCLLCLFACLVKDAEAQVESVEGAPSPGAWVSNGRLEGRLALSYSPEGAFSPEELLAVAARARLCLNLAQNRPRRS
jgi:hypothetical protein